METQKAQSPGIPFLVAARATLCVVVVALLAPAVLAQEGGGFSTWNIQAKYGEFPEPGITEDVPKTILTFEHIGGGRLGSTYLFVDVMRSWSEEDANAKEVYGEWYPSLSLRNLSGKEPGKGFVRDVSLTLGLNSGVRSTGPAPFVILPGVTVNLNIPKFAFASVGAYAYIDRGRFHGQPAGCHGTTWQVTPTWSLPFKVGGASMKVDGFVDVIGPHADCEAQILTQPRLALDLSGFWDKPGRVFVGVDYAYWHNKYGIKDFEHHVLLPVVIWVF